MHQLLATQNTADKPKTSGFSPPSFVPRKVLSAVPTGLKYHHAPIALVSSFLSVSEYFLAMFAFLHQTSPWPVLGHFSPVQSPTRIYVMACGQDSITPSEILNMGSTWSIGEHPYSTQTLLDSVESDNKGEEMCSTILDTI